ncbi:MAG: DUF1902 domain-containing protein [Roseovarius sp.]|nr:DUF1902 domain-containing protein [Roseovarius sp.]
MKPKELILRCMVEKNGDQWQALCLDLCLAAQADSMKDAMGSLEAMVNEYVYDALAGEDKAYADVLMSRKAPWQQWARYYFWLAIDKVHGTINDTHHLFKSCMPVIPGPPNKSCHV